MFGPRKFSLTGFVNSGAKIWLPNSGAGENLVSRERFGDFWCQLSSWFRTRRDRCGESQLGHATDTGRDDDEDHHRITGSKDQRIITGSAV